MLYVNCIVNVSYGTYLLLYLKQLHLFYSYIKEAGISTNSMVCGVFTICIFPLFNYFTAPTNLESGPVYLLNCN